MSGSEMLSALQALLQQLEAAQGAEDPEARSRLDQLRQQLGMLDSAQRRAAAAGEPASSAAAGGGAGGGAGARAASASAAAGPETTAAADEAVAVLHQMDELSARLTGLEDRLAHLDDGGRAVLLGSAGGWLGALQQAGEAGEVSTAAAVIVEEETVVVAAVNEGVVVHAEEVSVVASGGGGSSGGSGA